MTNPSGPRPSTVRLQRMVRAYRESAALMAGVELGLFTEVEHGDHTEATLSTALGLTDLHAERIIVACVGLGLLQRDGDKLRNAPDVQRFRVKGKRQYAGEWMLFTKADWNEWGRLSEHLRRTEDARADNLKVSNFSVEDARTYHRATYGREEFRAVVAKTFAVLKPGGEMHLIGEAMNTERTGPVDAALWGLSEAIVNGTGLAHSTADVEGYFAAAGFEQIETAAFVPGVLQRTHGRKPAD